MKVKKKFIICLCLFLFISPTLADTLNEERKFNIFAKLPLLPKIAVMEIATIFNIQDGKYTYEFNIKSKNIVEFIDQVNGKGEVDGFVNKIYQPINYRYKYTRKKKEKYVEINYANNKVNNIFVTPEYNKSELSPVSKDMLLDTIDPSSFFLNLLDYTKTGECKNKFKVFDGKRRYDVIFTEIIRNKKNGTIECMANQIKLGGYKEDEKVSDIFADSDYIKIIYENNNHNNFIGYEAKNGNIKLVINEIK